MQIWVDADACPAEIKKVLFRVADRARICVTLVANQALSAPHSPFIKKMQVLAGFDVADRKILEKMQPGDLVITADIPLASAVVDHGGVALNPRGELYTVENIGERLALRNLSTELRNSGVRMRGAATLSKRQVTLFANALDSLLAQRKKQDQ